MYVDFITDDHYKDCVRYVLDSFNNAIKLRDSLKKSIEDGDVFKSSLFNNVVDPFKMVFEVEKIGVKEWIRKEILRQLDKSVEQKMGEFHQRVLGGVEGWTDLKVGKGIDLVNKNETIFFEVKNKYNTCSDSALKDVRRKLEDITSKKHDASAYWAYIISNAKKKSGEAIWVKKGFNKIDSVKYIWGESVYEKVTGDSKALYKIYKTLPRVIAEVTKEDDIKDIGEIIEDIVNSLEDHFDSIQSQIYNKVF